MRKNRYLNRRIKETRVGVMVRHSFILFLLLLFSKIALQAQVEVNVKVRPDQTDLNAWMLAHQGKLAPEHIAEKAQSYPFLTTALRNQSLTPQPTPQLQGLFTLTFDSQNSEVILTTLRTSGRFEFVELNHTQQLHGTHVYPNPNPIPRPAPVPNDPRISEQWFHDYIHTFDAWNITRGSSDVVIGIIDTGLDYEHPEFDGQLTFNAAEDLNGNGTFDPWPATETRNGITGDFDGVDQDQNGFADDGIGYDFTDQPRSPFGGDYLFPDANPFDDNNHGTLVAGIVGAKADNNEGIAGIAPDCRLMTLRAFSASGAGEDDDIARAIIYAADNGVNILNFSFGDIYPSLTMHEAIKYAYARGVIMVGSAGNGTGDELHYPSNFNEVISVSATAADDDGDEFLWPLSSYGLTVSLSAPGSNILTTVVQDTSGSDPYGFFSGTSTAAPLVTGAAALILAQRGNCSPQQIRGILTASADDISTTGWDHLTGAGRVNLLQALQNVGASNVQLLSPLNDRGTADDTLWVVGTILDPQFTGYGLEYQAGTNGANSWTTLVTGLNRQVLADTLMAWNVSALPEGDYTLRLKVEKSDGSTAEDRIRVVIDRSAPEVEIKIAATAWDNNERGFFIDYRSSDRALVTVKYKSLAATDFEEENYDRFTRNGHFLLTGEELSPGDYAFFLEATNAAGLTGVTPLDTFSFESGYIDQTAFDTTGYSLPFGFYLPSDYDMDGDGLREIVLSEYDSTLSFGPLRIYEYNAGELVQAHEVGLKPILIPKAVANIDADPQLELLCSVNDSLYILQPTQLGAYPTEEQWADEGNGHYAATFGDTDGDGAFELLLKDFEDYFIYEPLPDPSAGFQPSATLEDISPDYQGSVAPRAFVDDLDADGNPDILYGDFDGDFLIYEHQGGANYANTWIDSTDLQKSGTYIETGDFDNNGRPEIFVAAHTSFLRNADFEYDAPYWLLRIFESTGDNQYAEVWREVLYDIDTESYNALAADNLDQDANIEILFSSFPRTYLIDHDGSDYYMRWFFYGGLQTHHAIADLNGNGIKEFTLGLAEDAPFFELNTTYTGPQITANLDGEIEGATTARLFWTDSPNANEYVLWRGEYIPGNTLISRVDSTAQTEYLDTGLTPDTEYLYVLQSKNTTLTPAYSDFSFAILLTPHAKVGVDSVVAVSGQQAVVYFSGPVTARQGDLGKFDLNGSLHPISVIENSAEGNRLLLSFPETFLPGTNILEVDTLFKDAFLGTLDPGNVTVPFDWTPDSSEYVFFTHWEVVSAKEAALYYNLPMDNSVLDPQNYTVAPKGNVIGVTWHGADQTGVKVIVDEVNFGALGAPLSVVVTNVTAQNGAESLEKEGNVATFSDHKEALSEVYVYPNPYRFHNEFEGVRFANLTQTAQIAIFNASGRWVATLQEIDGDGGVAWNLKDSGGVRVKPGIYLFRVTDGGLEGEEQEFIGKFSIAE